MIDRVNRAFDWVVIFFLLSGSLGILFYFLQSGKFIYIVLGIIIYCFSFFLRNVLFKVKKSSGFTEAGLFLISFLFLGCLLDLFKFDNSVRNYFPNRILMTSGVAFIFILIGSFLSHNRHKKLKFINIVMLVMIYYLLQINKDVVNLFVFNNPEIADFVIGTPIIYLGLLLTGLRNDNG